MLKVRRIGTFSALAGALLIASLAVPTSATTLKFGAKLTSSTQPQDASTCNDADPDIPVGAAYTWIAQVAFENGSHFKAPANGTIKKLRLVSCDAGQFRLQLVKPNSSSSKWKLVKNGPVIHYQADPRQSVGNCGGDNGDDYLIQTFKISVPVQKGEYIAVKTAKNGMLHCSGDSMPLYSPPLASGQGYRTKTGGTGCALLVQLQYG
jgi:hypothetical protein